MSHLVDPSGLTISRTVVGRTGIKRDWPILFLALGRSGWGSKLELLHDILGR